MNSDTPSFPLNQTKRKLLKGEPTYATSIHDIRGISIPHIFAQMGYDSLFFDMEHSPDDFGPMCDMIWSCRRSGVTPIVRVADPERFFLSRCLDAGAQGVIVPRVETVEQVDQIVSYCRYTPQGTRGIALGGRHMDYQGTADWTQTMKEANEQVLVGIMIETPEGMKALDALAARPGIDMLFIGPADLSVAVGTPGDLTSPEMDHAIGRIMEAARRNRLTVGIQGVNVELSTHWMKMGVLYFLYGNLMNLIRASAQQGINGLREAAQKLGKAGWILSSGGESGALASLTKGLDWLTAQVGPRGSIQDSDLAVVYYKSPAILALQGRMEVATRCLGWIETHFLNAKGELAIPDEQERANPFNTYDRGWVCWGAQLCGRYDLAARLADDICAFQDQATGGFWDNRAARDAGQGRQHAMSAGMAGLALLATHRVAQAEQAARFIVRILELQPEPEQGLFFALDAGPGGPRLKAEKTNIDFLDRRGLKQRPGRLGPILVLLLRLHRLTRNQAYLEAARTYTRAMLAAGEGAYLCVEGHKFVWGMTELAAIEPAPECAVAADKIVAYIVSRQRPDGQWQVDSGVTDPTQEQPLFWRIDTTCNVLVGLMHYCWARSNAPTPVPRKARPVSMY